MAQSASPCFSPSSLLLAGRVTGQSELINSPSLDPRSEEDFGHGASLSRESAPLVCCGLYALSLLKLDRPMMLSAVRLT